MIVCFKQKTAYEMRISDWSSDVCSSDLIEHEKVRTAKDRSIAVRLKDYLLAAENNDEESPLAPREQESLEVIRRHIQRANKRTTKLKAKLERLLVEKDAQDKITWKLQDD